MVVVTSCLICVWCGVWRVITHTLVHSYQLNIKILMKKIIIMGKTHVGVYLSTSRLTIHNNEIVALWYHPLFSLSPRPGTCVSIFIPGCVSYPLLFYFALRESPYDKPFSKYTWWATLLPSVVLNGNCRYIQSHDMLACNAYT